MAEIIVTMKHVRAANMCSRGARQWFASRGLDYNDFLKNGLPISRVDAIGDALADIIASFARLDAKGELDGR